MKDPSWKAPKRSQLAACIDHSLLGPLGSAADVRRTCEEALQERFAAVCVNGQHLPVALEVLQGSGIPVAVTIGFPLGACSAGTKAFEAREALELGALELDMVLALGPLHAGEDHRVAEEVATLASLCTPYKASLKVILETCLLSQAEMLRAIDLACGAGAHMLKTSTGFGSAGATREHVRLLRQHAPASVGVKAAGGIRTLADALGMLEAGATRLGCSASLGILDELSAQN